MEDNIQTIIVVIISVFLLFIFPVYMAYEKKDDISYALAMRYTQDLVDEVRSKGYITKYMYEDYKAKLKVTGNSYDIQMTHEYNRYDPITNYYRTEGNNYILVKTTTQEEKEEFENNIKQQGREAGILSDNSSSSEINKYILNAYKSQNIDKIEDTYRISKQIYTTAHILSVLQSEKKLLLNSSNATIKCDDDIEDNECQYAYTMNVDDNFNVTIKNTNTTLATVIYNMVTANTLDNNTRIYVNYGGDILASKWYGDIDYSKMKHDDLTLDKFEKTVIFTEERSFDTSKGANNAVQNIDVNYSKDYAIAFDVRPRQVTELREKGELLIADYTGYNFALGNNTPYNNNNMLLASVGINGVSLITNSVINLKSSTNGALALPYYNQPIERIDASGGTYIDYISTQRKITDYIRLNLSYVAQGKIKVTLIGRTGVSNYVGYITVSDDNNLLESLDKTIDNPNTGVVTGTMGQVANRGTSVNYKINITDSTIRITAYKYISNEKTILSYPVSIRDYINIKIEIKQKENKKYVALLFIDGEQVEESIEMDVMPNINSVGMSYIGNELRYFQGYIKNVELYN